MSDFMHDPMHDPMHEPTIATIHAMPRDHSQDCHSASKLFVAIPGFLCFPGVRGAGCM